MALVNRLKKIEKDYVGIPKTCHMATTYWLFEEAFGRPPTQDEFLDLGGIQVFVRSLIPLGVALQQSISIQATARLKVKKTGALVMPGSVVIFCYKGDAGHSCTATLGHRLAGYNQTDWFTSKGEENTFTEHHHTSEINWQTKHLAKHLETLHNLVAVFETDAINAIKAKFPKLKA